MAADELVISGNEVHVVERTVRYAIPLDQFYQAIQSESIMVSGRLPNNCIMVAKSGNSFSYVVEVMPGMRTISYNVEPGEDMERDYSLHLPWCYFIVTIETDPNRLANIDWLWSKERITGPESMMGQMAMPNTTINSEEGFGRICLGEVFIDDGLTVNKATDNLIEKVLGGKFNSDLFGVGPQTGIPQFMSHPFDSEHWIAERERVGNDSTIGNHIRNAIDGDSKIRYLMAWEALSREKGPELWDDIEFPITIKLSDVLDKYSQFKFLEW